MIATTRPADAAILQETADIAAPALLGLLLYRYLAPDTHLVARIVEVEAYRREDPASHSFRGPTKRNGAMFGVPGRAYVYLIYGVHHCMNVVVGPEGVGEAVLIRAAEPVFGLDTMWRLRHPHLPSPQEAAPSRIAGLLAGPGSLCKGLAVTRGEFDGAPLRDGGALQLVTAVAVPDPGPMNTFEARSPGRIESTPRIGITKAVERPWRFVDPESACLSRRLPRDLRGGPGGKETEGKRSRG